MIPSTVCVGHWSKHWRARGGGGAPQSSKAAVRVRLRLSHLKSSLGKKLPSKLMQCWQHPVLWPRTTCSFTVQMREPVSEAASRQSPIGHMIVRLPSYHMAEPTDQPQHQTADTDCLPVVQSSCHWAVPADVRHETLPLLPVGGSCRDPPWDSNLPSSCGRLAICGVCRLAAAVVLWSLPPSSHTLLLVSRSAFTVFSSASPFPFTGRTLASLNQEPAVLPNEDILIRLCLQRSHFCVWSHSLTCGDTTQYIKVVWRIEGCLPLFCWYCPAAMTEIDPSGPWLLTRSTKQKWRCSYVDDLKRKVWLKM